MSMAQEPASQASTKPKRKAKGYFANKPLRPPARELFAQQVAQGVKVDVAYRNAGYESKAKSAIHSLRYHSAVKARIEWLLDERIRSRFRRRTPGEKKALERQLSDEERIHAEYRAIAFGDVRDVVAWETVPVLDAEGNIIGAEDRIAVRPSADLTAAQAAMVKGVFNKAGAVRLELHDKLKALDSFAKALGLGKPDMPPPPAPVTINQLNVGAIDAQSAARKVAFLLSAAQAQTAPRPMVDVTPLQQGNPERDGD